MNKGDSDLAPNSTGGSFGLWLKDYGCSGKRSTNAAGGRFANMPLLFLMTEPGNPGGKRTNPINDSNFARRVIIRRYISYQWAVAEVFTFQYHRSKAPWETEFRIHLLSGFTGLRGAVDAYLQTSQMAEGGPTPTPRGRFRLMAWSRPTSQYNQAEEEERRSKAQPLY